MSEEVVSFVKPELTTYRHKKIWQFTIVDYTFRNPKIENVVENTVSGATACPSSPEGLWNPCCLFLTYKQRVRLLEQSTAPDNHILGLTGDDYKHIVVPAAYIHSYDTINITFVTRL